MGNARPSLAVLVAVPPTSDASLEGKARRDPIPYVPLRSAQTFPLVDRRSRPPTGPYLEAQIGSSKDLVLPCPHTRLAPTLYTAPQAVCYVLDLDGLVGRARPDAVADGL